MVETTETVLEKHFVSLGMLWKEASLNEASILGHSVPPCCVATRNSASSGCDAEVCWPVTMQNGIPGVNTHTHPHCPMKVERLSVNGHHALLPAYTEKSQVSSPATQRCLLAHGGQWWGAVCPSSLTSQFFCSLCLTVIVILALHFTVYVSCLELSHVGKQFVLN